MEIIYPLIVEEGVSYLFGSTATMKEKGQLYQEMVRKNIISETGLPTRQALDNELIKDYYEKENLSFEFFLELYPFFKSFAASDFQYIDGFWEIPITVKTTLQKLLETGDLSYDEAIQVKEYLADR